MIHIDLDIDMLRCFMAVAKTGSFTKAGKKIGLTQSGVSVKIRRLEERLSTQVFNRTSKSLSLTLEGETLLDYAGRILSVHDEAVNRLTKPKACGELRIGLIDYFLPELLPSLLSNFRKQYPNIHLIIQTDVGINLIPLFEKGELDLVVAGKDSYQGSCRVLIQEPLVWVMGKETEGSLDEVLNLVVLPSPCSFRKIATERLDKAQRKWEILFTGTSIGNIQAAVQAGIGVSILPKGALKEGLRKAPSHLELPELPMYSIVVITDEERENDARDVFISYLEAELNSIT
ncbi:MAG: LysR family transcriptional regulator [Proteobacteria bacterium]|nr:LysR family transcriptional regulator [Pseudomonadota bacterium]